MDVFTLIISSSLSFPPPPRLLPSELVIFFTFLPFLAAVFLHVSPRFYLSIGLFAFIFCAIYIRFSCYSSPLLFAQPWVGRCVLYP